MSDTTYWTIEDLLEQRDELLAALRYIDDLSKTPSNDVYHTMVLILDWLETHARPAIAKAEESNG